MDTQHDHASGFSETCYACTGSGIFKRSQLFDTVSKEAARAIVFAGYDKEVAQAEEVLPCPKTDTEPFDLTQIPAMSLRRLGAIFKEGEAKYGKNNWRSASDVIEWQLERANHAMRHLTNYVHQLQFGECIGEPGEDDLAKVAWFCVTQMELERIQDGTAAH